MLCFFKWGDPNGPAHRIISFLVCTVFLSVFLPLPDRVAQWQDERLEPYGRRLIDIIVLLNLYFFNDDVGSDSDVKIMLSLEN